MQQFIGCDAHKRYSVFVAVNEEGQAGRAMRIAHDRELYREFLGQLPQGSVIALEASGHYGWLVDEMERMGHRPRLANPLEAKRRMGKPNKTDKLDATGLAVLLRNGTLPEVWIPPGDLRDQRELLRMRIFLVRLRTQVKNRVHATLARHNIFAWHDGFFLVPTAALNWRLVSRSCRYTAEKSCSKILAYWIRWTNRSNPQNSDWKLSWRRMQRRIFSRLCPV